MKKILQSDVVALGLAIFSMLFGAGNLMYPLAVGMLSGSQVTIGMAGFLLTAICLPLLGIVAMILFNGDYQAFFGRLGKRTSQLMIFICMLTIGPMIAMPRIITLSHTMMTPFLPGRLFSAYGYMSSFLFALLFLGITFLLAYRESKIVDILGYVVSPLLLSSLAIIITKGFICAHTIIENNEPAATIFLSNVMRGYETLDLLGTIFFSAIILTILRSYAHNKNKTENELAIIGIKGGLIGIGLLGIVYLGMSMLGAYYGHGLADSNAGELFREISLRVLGNHGALVIATAVLMACLSTSVALSAVIAEYVQQTILNHRVWFVTALIITLISCIPLSTAGLDYVIQLTGGVITFVGYPTLIALTLANIAYKLGGLKMVRIPVYATFFITLFAYYWW